MVSDSNSINSAAKSGVFTFVKCFFSWATGDSTDPTQIFINRQFGIYFSFQSRNYSAIIILKIFFFPSWNITKYIVFLRGLYVLTFGRLKHRVGCVLWHRSTTFVKFTFLDDWTWFLTFLSISWYWFIWHWWFLHTEMRVDLGKMISPTNRWFLDERGSSRGVYT